MLSAIGVLAVVGAAAWLGVLVVGPKLVSLLGRVGPPRLDPVAALDGRPPRVTVMIAARNEEAGIGARLDNLFALEAPPGGLEIIVVSDGSTDATADVVRARAAHCPADRSLLLLEQSPNQGKEVALGVAARAATGDILALTDATTVWRGDVALQLVAALQEPGVGAASGRVVYDEAHTAVAGAFQAYQRFVVQQRRSIGGVQVSTSGACAAAWAVCFRRYHPDVNSDLQVPLLAAEDGLRTVYADGAIAYEETRQDLDVELRARMRIARRCLVSTGPLVRRLWRADARWQLAQLLVQKATRWLIWLPVGAAQLGLIALWLGSDGPIRLAALAAAVALATALAIGWARVRGHGQGLGRGVDGLAYLVLAVVATLLAALEIARGQRSLAWRPERAASPAGN